MGKDGLKKLQKDVYFYKSPPQKYLETKIGKLSQIINCNLNK